MRRFLSILITIGMVSLSHSSIAQSGNESSTLLTNTKHNVVRNVPKTPKLKLFRSNPHKLSQIIDDDSDDDYVNDDYIMSPYRQRDLAKVVQVKDINDNVRWKLFLIRQAALLKHKETWG